MTSQGSTAMVSSRSTEQHVTLAELILIAILGALASSVAAGFLLLYISRRRRVSRNAGLLYPDEDGEADAASSLPPDAQSRKKLRKTRMPTTAPSSPSEKGDGAEPWRFSSIRRTSLPILPPLFTKRSSFNPFAAPNPK